MKINFKIAGKNKKTIAIVIFVLLAMFLSVIYVPKSFRFEETKIFAVEKGQSDGKIARELEDAGIIKSGYFLRAYLLITGKHSKLQAGKYNFSSNMSMAEIANKLAKGDVINQTITILEGWDARDIGKYLESKDICKQAEFLELVKKDYSHDFDILKDIPASAGIEGFIFPDTYKISGSEDAEDIIKDSIANLDKKLTQELREAIAAQKKSIFEIITMASILEKEVKSLEDKKVVSGILWTRMKIGMPLQVDATINYITDGNAPGVATKDTRIDSPYNTYKYTGLPLGPISSPGMDSILAAIYPKETNYLFYMSSRSGKTIFSKTLQEHNTAVAKYLN